MKVPAVRRNLVPATAYLDRRQRRRASTPTGSVSLRQPLRWLYRGTEMTTSRFFSVEFDDIVEVCWPTLITDRFDYRSLNVGQHIYFDRNNFFLLCTKFGIYGVVYKNATFPFVITLGNMARLLIILLFINFIKMAKKLE